MTVQIDITNLLGGFALLMLFFWIGNFMLNVWRERRKRLAKMPKPSRRPAGYTGARPINYSEHPDAEVERSKGGEGF